MVSDKMDKTIVVSVEDRVKHALYGKVMRRTSRLKAHDEKNEAHDRRPRAGHGDPPALGDQALASSSRSSSAPSSHPFGQAQPAARR